MDKIHKHIMARVDGSTPKDDLRQLDFEPDELYEEILHNENMTVAMVEQMTLRNPIPQVILADYAMTWFSIGASMYKEKRDSGRPDSFPTLPDEPT